MHAFKALTWVVSILTALVGSMSAGAAEPSSPQLTPLVANVMAPPHAVPGSDQRIHLIYEIRVANATNGRMRLDRIAAIDAQAGTTLAILDAASIGARFSLGGRRGSESADLGPFQFGVVFMHVAVEPNALPTNLAHIIEGSSEQMSTNHSMRLAETAVIAKDAPSLGPPLRGH